MASTTLQWKAALVAGVATGSVMIITFEVYLEFQIGAARMNAIYATLAALPLLLIYLYYALDKRPAYFRFILALVTVVRKVVSRIHHPAFREFFTSPRIEPAAKKKILNAALSDKLGRPVLGILNVLIDKGREMILDNVVDEFERFRDFREGRIHAYVTTARPLEEEQRKELADRIARATDKEIAIHERIDPRILGGLIVKVGDKVLDGSIRRRLLALKQQLVAAKE